MTRGAFVPVKPCDPELPKAAVRRLFNENGGIKRTAVKLGLSETQTYAVSDPGTPDELSFARVAALTSHEAPAAAEYLAGLAGGVFLPVPCAEGDAQALTADSVRQHGEAIAMIVDALATDGIDFDEAIKALPEIDDALRALCGLRSLVVGVIQKKRSG